jgi:tRNA threonylcarbamoyl adenosine modification protein YeaZ
MILAIESAISGGSVSLVDVEREVARWIGNSEVVKGEMLLTHIDELLSANNVSTGDVEMIAVSAGPGSFTGTRTGLATALGLKAGFGIEMASFSALRAMVVARRETSVGATVAAVPVGRETVCFQSFRIDDAIVQEVGPPQTETQERFFARVETSRTTGFLLHGRLFDLIPVLPNATNFGTNLALAVAIACRRDPASADPPPLFISKGG